MFRFARSLGVVVGLGSVVGLMPGCSNHLGPVVATQAKGGIDRPTLPDIFIEHGKDCMAEHGGQLGEGQHVVNSTMEVNEDRAKVDVTIDGIPDAAADFGACMRIALQDMPIADEPFRQGVETLNYRRQEALAEQRKLVGHPVVLVIAGVTIIVSEVALEAGAITVLFAVTVKVVDRAKDDVIDLAKRWRPKPTLNRCLDAAAGGGVLWENLCNAMTNSVDMAQCWDKNLLSEQMKRNWCFAKFGS